MNPRDPIVQSWPPPDQLDSQRRPAESGATTSPVDAAFQGADLAAEVAEGVDLASIGSSALDLAGSAVEVASSAVEVVGGALEAVGELLGGIGDALN